MISYESIGYLSGFYFILFFILARITYILVVGCRLRSTSVDLGCVLILGAAA